MSILRRNKPPAECTLINEREDGTKVFVCKVDESKVFEVQVDKTGRLEIDAKFVVATPDDYRKIHEAIKMKESSVV